MMARLIESNITLMSLQELPRKQHQDKFTFLILRLLRKIKLLLIFDYLVMIHKDMHWSGTQIVIGTS